MSPLPSREERRAAGEAARARVPLAAHAAWRPAPDRPDPVSLLLEQAATRLRELMAAIGAGRVEAESGV